VHGPGDWLLIVAWTAPHPGAFRQLVSEADLLRRVEGGTVRRLSWWSRLLGQPDARARDNSRGPVRRDTDAAEIADLMESWRIKRVPAVRGGKLAGIVSRWDLLRAVSRGAGQRIRKGQDGDIRNRLRRKIDAAPWLGSGLVSFAVRKGKIELAAIVPSEAQRRALRVLAENLVGLRAVTNRLSIMPREVY